MFYDIHFTDDDIKHWKKMLIDNYFNRDAIDKNIWSTLKDLNTPEELTEFEEELSSLVKEKAKTKSIEEIYEEVKATKYLRKLGIKVKGYSYEHDEDKDFI